MIVVEHPGQLTTIQDLGRPGYQHLGIPLSGAVDPFALQLANLLVGNPPDAAALECTLVGPVLLFQSHSIVAITGATPTGIPTAQALTLQPSQRLDLRQIHSGCRAYLAVRGGLDVPPLLGSRSTYLRAALGGFSGRALQRGDLLLTSPPPANSPWLQNGQFSPRHGPPYSSPDSVASIRFTRGPQAHLLSNAEWQRLLQTPWTVSPRSDRMGLRLTGPSPWTPGHIPPELTSEATTPGTLQLPPDGQPITLLADCQTLGGYLKPAVVIRADLPLLAQLRPGSQLRFHEISLQEAITLNQSQAHTLKVLQQRVRYQIP